MQMQTFLFLLIEEKRKYIEKEEKILGRLWLVFQKLGKEYK